MPKIVTISPTRRTSSLTEATAGQGRVAQRGAALHGAAWHGAATTGVMHWIVTRLTPLMVASDGHGKAAWAKVAWRSET